MTMPAVSDQQMLEQLRGAHQKMRSEVGKIIIGQERVLDQLLMAIFCRGHALLVGVPGLAKTLMVSTLAQALDLSFKRIQFTPDLMPTDITGTDILADDPVTRERMFKFVPGPLFAHIILADEINRTPPKTQAALLESMQERKASIGGTDYPMSDPFFVLATQNPIDQEGTYPLPEAQKDRFLLNTFIAYPKLGEEEDIVERTTMKQDANVQAVCDRAALLTFQHLILSIPVSRHVTGYAVDLVRATRPNEPGALPFVKEQVGWGAGPRASQALIHCAKCYAALSGRLNVSCDDVRHLAHPVLRHRLLPSFAAEAEGITADAIVKQLLDKVPERKNA